MGIQRIVRAVRARLRAAFAVWRAPAVTERRLRGAPMRRVLVLCYGNIYRSAYLGAFLRQHVGADVEVRSAGFHAQAGRPSPARHVSMCQLRGVSLAEHRSRIVSPQDVEWADTVVIMDRHNWLALDAMSAAPEKLLWAGVLASGKPEISDPYGLDDTGAERILARLEAAAQRLAGRLGNTRETV